MSRPIPRFQEFIGQRRLVSFVERLIAGSQRAGAALPPLMLVGPPGFGKTSFAEAMAVAFDTDFHPVVASSKCVPDDIYTKLRSASFGDVLFVDEAHSLNRDCQESLHITLDKHLIPRLTERGGTNGGLESVADFTLVLATNFPGKVGKPLRTRTTQLQFERYSQNELIAIARDVASRFQVEISAQAARLIAQTAQGTPRIVKRRVKNLVLYRPDVRDFSLNTVRDYLEAEGIDRHGLSPLQRTYLAALAKSPRTRANVEQLAVMLGVDAAFIRQEIELFLFEEAWVEIASNNVRMLTDEGKRIADEI